MPNAIVLLPKQSEAFSDATQALCPRVLFCVAAFRRTLDDILVSPPPPNSHNNLAADLSPLRADRTSPFGRDLSFNAAVYNPTPNRFLLMPLAAQHGFFLEPAPKTAANRTVLATQTHKTFFFIFVY